jgi:DNA-binding IclR family transcriptional regulator
MRELNESAPGRVQSVDRVVALLDQLAAAQGSLGVGELSRQVGLSKGTVHRLLTAMQIHRLVEQDPNNKQYRLGFRLVQYGNNVIRQLDRPRLAEPHLRALVESTLETAHLAMLADGRVYYIAKVEGVRALRMPSHVGASNPVYCTAVGKAILAARPVDEAQAILAGLRLERRTPNTITDRSKLMKELERTRRRGYAVDNEELEEGLRCVAAAITDHTGQAVAAVSVSGPAGRILAEGRGHTRLAGLVVAAAEAISREFGSVG